MPDALFQLLQINKIKPETTCETSTSRRCQSPTGPLRITYIDLPVKTKHLRQPVKSIDRQAMQVNILPSRLLFSSLWRIYSELHGISRAQLSPHCLRRPRPGRREETEWIKKLRKKRPPRKDHRSSHTRSNELRTQ